MKFIKQFLKSFFFALGICALVYIISDAIFTDKITTNLLYALTVICFVITLSGTLLFGTRKCFKNLWQRRTVLMVICAAVVPAVMMLFDVIPNENLLIYILISVILIIVSCIISFILADKKERQTLNKINNILNRN